MFDVFMSRQLKMRSQFGYSIFKENESREN